MEAPTPFKRKQNMVQFESDWIVVCFHLDGRKKCQKPNLSSNMSLTDSVWLMWWLDLGAEERRSMKDAHPVCNTTHWSPADRVVKF